MYLFLYAQEKYIHFLSIIRQTNKLCSHLVKNSCFHCPRDRVAIETDILALKCLQRLLRLDCRNIPMILSSYVVFYAMHIHLGCLWILMYSHFIKMNAHYKCFLEVLRARESSALKSTCCSCRGPGYSFQNPHDCSHCLKLQVQGIQHLPLISVGTKNSYNTYPCTWQMLYTF